jgi:hypothetical protein
MPILLVRNSLIQLIYYIIQWWLYVYFQIKDIFPLYSLPETMAKHTISFASLSIHNKFPALHKFAREIVKSKIKQYITSQNHMILAAGKRGSSNPAGILNRSSLADTRVYLPTVLQPAHIYRNNTFTHFFVGNQHNTTFIFFGFIRPQLSKQYGYLTSDRKAGE